MKQPNCLIPKNCPALLELQKELLIKNNLLKIQTEEIKQLKFKLSGTIE